MLCQNDSFSLSIILRSTSTTEDLLHIENTNILERALRRIINFGPLDDYPVRGQVHTPGERGRGAEDFDVPVSEEVFDEVAVFAEHAGVVGGEAEVEQFFYLEVAGGDHLFFLGVGLFAIKQMFKLVSILLDDFLKFHGSIIGLCALMCKDNHLFAHSKHSCNILKDDIIHDVIAPFSIAHTFNAVKRAFQWCRSITGVKCENSFGAALDEVADVFVVGEGGGEADEADGLLVFVAGGDGSGDEAFED